MSPGQDFDHLGAGYFVSAALESCPNLRELRLRNVFHLSEDMSGGLGHIPESQEDGLSPNSRFLIDMAYKWKYLEILEIESLRDFSPEALSTLLRERKNTLKKLSILGGYAVNGSYLSNLPECQKLESLTIECGYKFIV